MHIETISNYETVSPIIIYQSTEKTHVSFNISRLVAILFKLYVASYTSTYLHNNMHGCIINVALITTDREKQDCCDLCMHIY